MSATAPIFPVYIVSKGRADTRPTSRALEAMGVPYRIVVEEQERDVYAAVIDPGKILVLDPDYQRGYDTFDDLGDSKSRGPGPARNFVWDHSLDAGHAWHWVMDDNITQFHRLNHNLKVPVRSGRTLRAMEEFCLRYRNVAMAGPNYFMFAPRKSAQPPFSINTRIYSCNLIRNDVPFRWRGRYNEDTDLALRMLKAKWCTILFNAFLQEKITTQTLRGGCTDEFYLSEGTLPKSKMLVAMHSDVASLAWRWGRWHHRVDYRGFRANRLLRRDDVDLGGLPAVDEHGMELVPVAEERR